MDEAVAGFASWIEVELCTDGTLMVTDNGRGIPVDPHPKFKDKSALEVILTTLHAGGKFDSKVYETSGGLHGVGVSVVNALSETLVVEVARNKKLFRQTFQNLNVSRCIIGFGFRDRRWCACSFRSLRRWLGRRLWLCSCFLWCWLGSRIGKKIVGRRHLFPWLRFWGPHESDLFDRQSFSCVSHETLLKPQCMGSNQQGLVCPTLACRSLSGQ
jgi:hypothetical protein